MAPGNSSNSRRGQTLENAILTGIEMARTILRHHQIKLLRSLVTTAKMAFVKLIQDYQALEDCDECTVDKTVGRADEKKLMGLIQYIVHGLTAESQQQETIKQDFEDFAKENDEALSERVEAYYV